MIFSPVQEIRIQVGISDTVYRVSRISCNGGYETVDHKNDNTGEDNLDQIYL